MIRWIVPMALGLSLSLAPALAFADHHEKGPKVEKMKGADKSAEKAMGDEMRDRRDEGKAIKGAYKEDVKDGAERVKGKKPWWKFWGSEE